MQVDIWKISGSSGFHFGRHGLGQEETFTTMSSDSLFAALVNRLAAREGANVDRFIEPFKNEPSKLPEPPFALSSTFPFVGNVLFFPVPFASVGETAKEDDAKKYKRVRYVSEKIFRQLIAGENLADVYKGAHPLMRDTVLLAEAEKDNLPGDIREGKTPIWSVESRPRVALGRAEQNSSIYFTGRVTYAKDCGLWFGIYWHKQDDMRKKQTTDSFADLSHSGLGAERSAGFGACEIKVDGNITLPEAEGKPWVSLSRYIPRMEETNALKNGAYKIVNVGGWVDMRGHRRRAVNMLEEGATLGNALSAIPGEMADVQPRYKVNDQILEPLGHAVYRSGLALAVAWKGALK